MKNRKLWLIVSIFILALGVLVLAVAGENLSKDCSEQVFNVVMVDNELGFLRTTIDGKEVIPENGGDLANSSTKAVITAWYNATDNTVEPHYYLDTYGLIVFGLVLCAAGAGVFFISRRRPKYYY